ncbi:hypothetical protein AB0C65_35935 [Nocardia sp. NPDC048505]|uniref:hypothetical protein n=1 Tax=Nocardia sp. NPDC048505 TaxID=3155756 RepID=UPI0033EADE61
MAETQATIDREPTALDVAGEMINRVKATDPADLEAVLFTTWDALRLTLVLDRLLAARVAPIDHLPFPGFTWQPCIGETKLDLAMTWVEAAPSLPNVANSSAPTDWIERPLMPAQLAEDGMDPTFAALPGHSPAEKRELIGAEVVHLAIRTIWLRLHDLLTAALPHSHDAEDGKALRVAALMTKEMADPYDVDTRRDLSRRVIAVLVTERLGREALCADEKLMATLHTAVTRCADRESGWAPIPRVGAALKRIDGEWMPERWGFDTDLGLISATGQFAIRKVTGKGRKKSTEIRART